MQKKHWHTPLCLGQLMIQLELYHMHAAADDLRKGNARARQGAFDGDPVRITEMDALVAYLQMLGTLVDFRDVTPAQLRQQ